MKQKLYLPEIWWMLEYEVKETEIEFEAFKIVGLDDTVPENSDLEESPEITGYIKWDECVNFTQDSHYCDLEYAEQTFCLFKEIYKLRFIHFGDLDE